MIASYETNVRSSKNHSAAWKNPHMLKIAKLDTPRLRLDPISIDDADTLVDVFDHPAMLEFIGGDEPTRDVLRGRFERMPAGSGNEVEAWLTWIVRFEEVTTGIVQATVRYYGADLAWVIGLPWQNQGLATEAGLAMRQWLVTQGVTAFLAHIHPDNAASNAVAANLGLRSSGSVDDDGEVVWLSDAAVWPPAGTSG